ncbi:MAG: molybdopterin-dependent oxidoreductase, partial [Dehalococcoidia bacterium]
LADALVAPAGAPAGDRAPVPPGVEDSLPAAIELLAAVGGEAGAPASMVYTLPHFGPEVAAAITAALANIAVTCSGEEAAEALFVLPQEGNLWGMRDAGVSPELLPGHRSAGEAPARQEVERLWGAPLPSDRGLTYEEMLAGTSLKALVVLGDNPLLLSPNQGSLRRRLGELDLLAVIDSLATDTAKAADVVLPDVAFYGKEGTTTSADRRILRLHTATAPEGEAQPAWRILGELGARLAQRLQAAETRISYAGPAAIMEEMAQLSPLYADATYRELESGAKQRLDGLGPKIARLQPVPPVAPPSPAGDGFLLATGRSLYTSYEGAALHSPDADKLHREEFVEMNPADAAALAVGDGDPVVLRRGSVELAIRVRVTAAVQPRTLYVPLYFDGGAVGVLFSGDRPVEPVTVAAGRVAQ